MTDRLDGVLGRRLTSFLSQFELAPQDLQAEVERAFGKPLLVLATGSVLLGFANDRSDVDLIVVVDRGHVTQLPVMSYAGRARIDTTFYSARDLDKSVDLLRSGWPPSGVVTYSRWLAQLQALGCATRLASGFVLEADVDRGRSIAALRTSWLRERMASWWSHETLRCRAAARWLFDTKPLTACQRYCDAVLAALQIRTSLEGQLYLETYPDAKWLPEKIRSGCVPSDMHVLHQALRTPLTTSEAPNYRTNCEDVLAGLLDGQCDTSRLAFHLTYAPGVRCRRFHNRTVVSRWDLRGLELADFVLPDIADESAVVWEGDIDCRPAPTVLELFREDLLWLGVANPGESLTSVTR